MSELIKWPENNFTKDGTKKVILMSIEDDIEKTVKEAAKLNNFAEQAESHISKLHRLLKMKDYCNNTLDPENAKDKPLLLAYLKAKKVCPHRTPEELAAYVAGMY